MKRSCDGIPFLKCAAWLSVVFSVVFMILQLVSIPGLSGVHLCTESCILLLVWIVIGVVFYTKQKRFFDDENS